MDAKINKYVFLPMQTESIIYLDLCFLIYACICIKVELLEYEKLKENHLALCWYLIGAKTFGADGQKQTNMPI